MEYETLVQDEELNMRIVRIINNCVLAYIIPIWLRLVVGPVGRDSYVSGLVMVAMVLLFAVIQDRVKNFFLYMILHILCIMATGLLSFTLLETVLHLAVAVVATCIAITTRLHGSYAIYPSWPFLSIGILIYMCGAYTGSRALAAVGYASEVIMALLCLVYYNGKTLVENLEIAKRDSKVPLSRIRKTNTFIIMVFTVICGALIALSSLFTLGRRVFDAVGQGLRWAAAMILRFFFWLASLFPQGSSQQTAAGGSSIAEMLGGAENENRFLEIFWRVLEAAAGIAAIAFCAFLLYRALKALYGDFSHAEVGGVQELRFAVPHDVQEGTGKREEDRVRFFDRSHSARIRREYIRLIRRSPHLKDIRAYHTPQELEEASGAGRNDAENLYTVHRLYEKARYSPKDCTAEDAATMRRCAGKL